MSAERPGIVLLLGVLAAANAGAQPATKIVGYSTSWSGDAASVPMAKLTHVIYAFVVPSADGAVPAVKNPTKLEALVTLARGTGTKVLIAAGGWNNGDDSGFEALAASAPARARFVAGMLSLVKLHSLDGIDVDWEYPDAGASSQNFSLLMRELCGALHAQGKLCTAAVAATERHGAAIAADVFGAVDFLNLMAYDGGNGPEHSPLGYAVASLDYWLGRGLPAPKAILGVPFYGRPNWEKYAAIVARDAEAPGKDESNGVHYNGRETMRRKAALALERGGGVMIWELAQDTSDDATSLSSALVSVLRPALAK
jgi:GH18 family chitinase